MLTKIFGVFCLVLIVVCCCGSSSENFYLKEHKVFLNFGDKKLSKNNQSLLEDSLLKSKVEVLGDVFKTKIQALKENDIMDLVFLIDASSSVGEENFQSELKFVKKFLSDVTVDINHTRVAIVTFGSTNNVFKSVDEISEPSEDNNKCLLLNKELQDIKYTGGGTYTLGAFQLAKSIFKNSRKEAKKALFLITDGFSNGGDPVPVAKELKDEDVTIFTLGVQNGNYKELFELASTPGEVHSYLLDSFQEFESLARRALHADLQNGDYIPMGLDKYCNNLCENEVDCCDKKAVCTCGTSSGQYSCICQPGFYGSGLKNSCSPCPSGTYSTGPNICLPCPDINHITDAPAFGIESCKCKLGFQATTNNKCEVTKCLKLEPPEFGYFVKKRECNNVLHSACGMRCEVGYTLTGNSIRLCQQNGTWSGKEPTCHIRSCQRIVPPTYGTMHCENPDLAKEYDEDDLEMPVDTVCSFKCGNGRSLIGSVSRTCLPIAQWDGLKTSCKQLKCPKLSKGPFVVIEPLNCTAGRQPYGKKCTISCPVGFKLTGPKFKECTGLYGSWTDKNIINECLDVTPPSLKCPENITGFSLPKRKFGVVNWTVPDVTDNSGLEVTTWTKPSIKKIDEFKFKIGKTTVTYFAQDSFKNVASCMFTVEVFDNEPPIIENCINPPIFLSSNALGDNITWDEPNIFDNSQQVSINKSREFGFFSVGTTEVVYKAWDANNNTNTCVLNITVQVAACPDIPSPPNGRTECILNSNLKNCIVTCEEGYAIPIGSGIEQENGSLNIICENSDFSLVNTDFYSPFSNQDLTFPECTLTKLPEEVIQEGNVILETDKTEEICNDVNKLVEFENKFKNDLKLSLDDCGDQGDCNLNATVVCEENLQSEEEKTNRIRRQVETSRKNKRRKYKSDVNVKFTLRMKIKDKNDHKKSAELQKRIKKFQSFPGNKTKEIRLSEAMVRCPLGHATKKFACVLCPKGTFHNTTKQQCQSCQIGEYNDIAGQTACKKCPLYHSTRRSGSKNYEDCVKECGPGTVARKRPLKRNRKTGKIIEKLTLQPRCKSCPIGTYQEHYNQVECTQCPLGYTTLEIRSLSREKCVLNEEKVCFNNSSVCNNGQCVMENGYYSCVCPKNYIGSYCEFNVNSCHSNPCKNGGYCHSFPITSTRDFRCICPQGFSGKFCEIEIDFCPKKCFNNGTCVQDEDDNFLCICPKGFGGDNCQIKIHHCRTNYCENNGRCVELYNGFKCICKNGYIGTRCNLLPCDYQKCSGNSTCLNLVQRETTRDSYMCECPAGYAGIDCTKKINYCIINPCFNGGTCTSNENNYTCTCNKLFYGKNCENKYQTNYILQFPKSSTTDYISLNGFEFDLNELTVCLWLKTLDNLNYGTLISYANKNYDNAFTLTDYTGLVIYINNQYVVTDVFLNDGKWHHLCFTWTSINGTFMLYIDGTLRKSGTGLSANKKIIGNGKFVIGQDQDALESKFSRSESFLGFITYLDLWKNVLGPQKITENMLNCKNEYFGDVYAWPTLQKNLKGDVKILPSNFCKNCNVPVFFENGFVTVKDNKLFYNCYDGFYLKNSYENGRMCNKASNWDGVEPMCVRKNCGPPQYIKNGYYVGRSYYYNDTIIYKCNVGFNMSGLSILTCDKDGFWTPKLPFCLGNYCELFPKPKNTKITILPDQESYENYIEYNSFFDYDVKLKFDCEPGFKLNGEPVITCLNSSRFSNFIPYCEKDENEALIPQIINIVTTTASNIETSTAFPIYSTTTNYNLKYGNTDISNGNKNISATQINLKDTKNLNASTGTTNINFKDAKNVNISSSNTKINLKDPKILNTSTSTTKINFKDFNTISTTTKINFKDPKDVSTTSTTPKINAKDPKYLSTTTVSYKKILSTTNKLKSSVTDKMTSSTIATTVSTVLPKTALPTQAIMVEKNTENYTTEKITSTTPNLLKTSTKNKIDDVYSTITDNINNAKVNNTKTVNNDSVINIKNVKLDNVNKNIANEKLNGEKIVSNVLNGTTNDISTTTLQPFVEEMQTTVVPTEFYNESTQFNNLNIATTEMNYISTESSTTFNVDGGGSGTNYKNEENDDENLVKCDLSKIPLSPLNGYILEESLNNFRKGLSNSIKYKCRNGHTMTGSDESACIEDGYWTDIDLKCNLIPCPEPPTINFMQIKNDNISTTGYYFGNMVIYKCTDGYKMVGGKNIIRCTDTGRWSRMTATCRRISCFKPIVSQRTTIKGSSYLYQDKVVLTCKNKQSYTITCGMDGKWFGEKSIDC